MYIHTHTHIGFRAGPGRGAPSPRRTPARHATAQTTEPAPVRRPRPPAYRRHYQSTLAVCVYTAPTLAIIISYIRQYSARVGVPHRPNTRTSLCGEAPPPPCGVSACRIRRRLAGWGKDRVAVGRIERPNTRTSFCGEAPPSPGMKGFGSTPRAPHTSLAGLFRACCLALLVSTTRVSVSSIMRLVSSIMLQGSDAILSVSIREAWRWKGRRWTSRLPRTSQTPARPVSGFGFNHYQSALLVSTITVYRYIILLVSTAMRVVSIIKLFVSRIILIVSRGGRLERRAGLLRGLRRRVQCLVT